MAGFYLCRDDERAESRIAAARAQFARHGFGTPVDLAAGNYRGFCVPCIHGGPDNLVRDGDDFIAAAGTAVYGGQLGADGLGAMLAEFNPPFADCDSLSGHAGFVVRKADRTWVFGSFFGAFQIFHDPGCDVISTSFLAVAAACPRLTWDAQGLYEFAFNVFPTGDDSVFAEVRRLGPGCQLELGATVRHHRVAQALEPLSPRPREALLAETAERLRSLTGSYAAAYGDRVQCPLSGGLDSRLALALLRDAGIKPHVYVYGAPGDADVEIARAIAHGEGFDLEVFQKAAWRPMPTQDFAAQVERNFHEVDALATDGGLFDNGGNAHARHARQSGGQLAVSGGCGEVLRNFFYLPDKHLRARDVMSAFFARYTERDLTGEFDGTVFLDRLEDKALEAIGHSGDHGPLDRVEIEKLYPAMRCRAFFGREISLVARHGGYFMPFYERPVVEAGLAVPMADKDLGRFESALLARIDPKLAAYPSAYGHSFTEPPSLSHRFEEWSTRVRPAWMRRQSYALRRRIGPMADDHGGLLTPIYMGQVVDLHFPHMSRFFCMKGMNDSGLFRRIATLEYLGQHLAGQIAG